MVAHRIKTIWSTWIIVGMLVLTLPLTALIFWFIENQSSVSLYANAPENGGWQPNTIQIQAGKPLTLKLRSNDVVHSFAIAKSDNPPVDLFPGDVRSITLTFDQPGVYTFYCTRWCGLDHWRMRGTIEVLGDKSVTDQPAPQAAYLLEGIDLDAPHESPVMIDQTPSSIRGSQYQEVLPAWLLSRDTYLTNSPYQVWLDIRGNPGFSKLTDQTLWDITDTIWKTNRPDKTIETGKELYQVNCAACHGDQGKGDGVYAEAIRSRSADPLDIQEARMFNQGPVDFTNQKSMLGASPILLQGKILRGGMGTNMPGWGKIFTEDQTWALVAYLWSFVFPE